MPMSRKIQRFLDPDTHDIIPHIFLPLKLPGVFENIIDIETMILSQFTDCFKNFLDAHNSVIGADESAFESILSAFNYWQDIESHETPDPKLICEQISNLCPGESFIFYARCQNAGIIIKNEDDHIGFVSTFPGNQMSGRVTEAQRDLIGTFPTTSVTIPVSSILKSSSFARQLGALTSEVFPDSSQISAKCSVKTTEIRDVPNTFYVSKWLVGSLMNEKSNGTTEAQVFKVTKKIRDSVIWDNSLLPWRRSGLWFSIKVILQVLLIEKFGKTNGTIFYKILLIEFMLTFLNEIETITCTYNLESEEVGLYLEMMGKVSRRSRKLQILIEDNKHEAFVWIHTIFNSLMNKSLESISRIRKNIERVYWSGIISTSGFGFNVSKPTLLLEHYLHQHGPLKEFLDSKKAIFNEIGKMYRPIINEKIRHYDHTKLMDYFKLQPTKSLQSLTYEEIGEILFDFEQNVDSWEKRNLIDIDSGEYVWSTFQQYTKLGKFYYSKDPIGYSRMILTCLKIVYLWDHITITAVPLLAEHLPGVNMTFTKCLLLPTSEETEDLQIIERYFHLRRKNSKGYPSLIDEQTISVNSYAVRHVNQDPRLTSYREHLLKFGKENIEAKLLELKKVKARAQLLISKIDSSECHYEIVKWRRVHMRWKCARCKYSEEYKNLFVCIYEFPLPYNLEEQNAVIFELSIPTRIAVLRDLYFLFGHLVTNIFESDKSSKPNLYGPWTNYEVFRNMKTRNDSWHVNLISSKKRFMDTHYNKFHATNPESDFIKPNGFNVLYGICNKPGVAPKDTISNSQVQVFENELSLIREAPNFDQCKKNCTLKVSRKTPYASLQWAIDGGQYTPNEVLNKLSECHRDMSYQEFIDFGSLRCYPKLQLRNLYRSLTQMTLSLKNDSALNLVCQTIYEAGPNSDFDALFRDGQKDLLDRKFVQEFLCVLKRIIERHSNNWKDNFILLTVIQLLQKILSIYAYQFPHYTDEIRDMAQTLLVDCLKISMRWSENIDQMLSQMHTAPRSEIDNLRFKMIEVNICVGMTFGIKSDTIIQKLLADPQMIVNWLSANTKIYDSLVLILSGQNVSREILLQKMPTLQNLLHRIREIALHLEPYISKILRRGCESSALDLFVEKNYVDAENLFEKHGFPTWYQHPECQSIYIGEVIEDLNNDLSRTLFQIEIVDGSFLINGCPVSYLPSNIESHPDFQRTFPTKSFEVQPYTRTFQQGRMITKNKYLGSYYSFYLQMDGSVVITEHLDLERSSKIRILIPHQLMVGYVPHRLVNDYTHWLVKKGSDFESIDFFPRNPDAPIKLITESPIYRLDFANQFKLVDLGSKREVISIRSQGFLDIVNTIKRLENEKNIIMYSDEKFEDYNCTVRRFYTVELPRMGLKFNVGNLDSSRKYSSITLNSQEFRGMRVAESQEIDTLIGLWNGLLLEDMNCTKKEYIGKQNCILLVPHGIPIIDGDHQVRIDTTVLRSPPFFAYEVDERLLQLRAGESQAGWAYLSLLHGLTSSTPLPDPFTRVIGYERALQILQSGHCFSSEPYDRETLRTFRDILKLLVPVREYYPDTMKVMEQITWPRVLNKELSPYITHEAYRIIIEKLIENSQRLVFLYPDNFVDDSETNLQCRNKFQSQYPELVTRAYWRRSILSTELGLISKEFDKDFTIEPLLQPTSVNLELQLKSEVMPNVLKLVQCVHKWDFGTTSLHPFNQIKQLLLTGPDLKGIYPDVPFPIKVTMHAWMDLSFRNHWLDLYQLARKVRVAKLEAEWLHIITLFAFRNRDPVDIEQLLILQIIAVNSGVFKSIDPPDYCEYSLTKVSTFERKCILEYLQSNPIPWECWMDEHATEKAELETEEKFIDRMKPQYELLIESEAQELTTLLQNSWPIDNCEKLFTTQLKEKTFQTIDLNVVKQTINHWLKNWYQNMQLGNFLGKVEETVSNLMRQKGKMSQFKFIDTSKQLQRGSINQRKELEKIGQLSPNTYRMTYEKLIELLNPRTFDPELYEKLAKWYNMSNSSPFHREQTPRKSLDTPPFIFSYEDQSCPIIQEYMKDLKNSWNQFYETDIPDRVLFKTYAGQMHYLRPSLAHKSKKLIDIWEQLENFLLAKSLGSTVLEQLINSGLYPRLIPINLLRLLLDNNTKPNYQFIQNVIGGFGVFLTEEQRATRLVRYQNFMDYTAKRRRLFEMYKLEIISELANPGHEWIPSSKPHWLLFEIEMDLRIRNIQVQVAQHMIQPKNNSNALLQLNMGEGKTSVIVPIVLLELANSQQLARLTVLKPLFQINQKALMNNLGGLLLNRRLYSFPCRRDYRFGSDELRIMKDIYEECVEYKGIVITLPEYRLSFQLKAYEMLGNERYEEGTELLKIGKWLDRNARDILDESDEILNVKYQLVYTIGKQMGLGGSSLRWKIIQKLLKLVPKEIEFCLDKYGRGVVEMRKRKRTQKFPYLRILKIDCYETLCNRIATLILNGEGGIQIPEIQKEEKKILLEFLTNEKVDKDIFMQVFNKFPEGTHLDTLLILRGIMACGVLSTSLTKRWRVNYGVNSSGYRRMAVPFRAKDVASDRTEFGHPDIAILLTQFSYYYSGLTDKQLEHAFALLALQSDPAYEYNHWISNVDPFTLGYETIRSLTGVNLKDFNQRTQILFPALRKNTYVIDFWLNEVVYPSESKQFGLKIGTSPWDLTEERSCPTTGFSGTNDSKILLPKTIQQKDLPELQGTNGKVLTNILHNKNNYEVLEFGITGKEILQKLVADKIRVLLDVGALMLELNNEQVAREWLKLTENIYTIEGAVYFDSSDKLVVLQRYQRDPVSLELSTFRTRLDRCVIYLDDVHTRGTDLKIPPGITGVVTLGKGVTKDKLVQGCMRMRKLGHGHNINFWASQEVDDGIRELIQAKSTSKNDSEFNKTRITTQHVLEWSIENSRQAIKDGFIHWAFAGVYQAQKLSSLRIFEASKQLEPDKKLLAENCSLKETTDLKRMYGDVRTLKTLPVIVEHQLKRVDRDLKKHLKSKTQNIDEVSGIVESFGKCVLSHSLKYVSDLERPSQSIDEEQERELEHEMEAQVARQNPPKVKSNEHSTSEAVEKFIMFGNMTNIEKWALQVPLTLKTTNLWKLCPNDKWGLNVYATLDFSRVAKNVTLEQTLRPVNWFCSLYFPNEVKENSTKILPEKLVILLLSPYEVNYYWNLFKSGNCQGVLHMYTPRLGPDQGTIYKNQNMWIGCQNKIEFLADTFISLADSSHINSILLLFTGSSFFESEKEQNAYCKFLGLCLRPRTKEEDAAFSKGYIINGYLKPGKIREELGFSACRFDSHPEPLIRGIIERRYGSFPVESHIGKIILHAIKPIQPKEKPINGFIVQGKFDVGQQIKDLTVGSCLDKITNGIMQIQLEL